MRFKHAGRARAAIAVAGALALAAAASPAAADVHVGVKQAVLLDHPRHGEAIGVGRSIGQFRGRYQLRLGEARAIVGH